MPENKGPDQRRETQVTQPHGQVADERSQQDYSRQQEDIRANQTYGESSLEKVSDRENQRNIGRDEISPQKERGYDITPTATPPKLP